MNKRDRVDENRTARGNVPQTRKLHYGNRTNFDVSPTFLNFYKRKLLLREEKAFLPSCGVNEKMREKLDKYSTFGQASILRK